MIARGAILLAGLLAAFAAPATAGAATVSVQTSDQVTYLSVAGGAENDALTLSSPAPNTYDVVQKGAAPLAATLPCRTIAPGHVQCATRAPLAGALVRGGPGNDTLAVAGALGSGAWIYGDDGDDSITGSTGADRLDGGTGNDTLVSRDSAKDFLFCGPGADVYDADALDIPFGDCETRAPGALPAAPVAPSPAAPLPSPLPAPVATHPVTLAPGPVTMSAAGVVPIKLQCAPGSACRGVVTLRLSRAGGGGKAAAAAANRGLIVARKHFSIKPGKLGTIKVHMSRRGRIRVLANRRARCSVAVASTAADGTKTVRRQTVTIKAGGK